jgi:hypothetical protein
MLVSNVFLPNALMARLQRTYDDKEMLAVSTFLINVVSGTLKTLAEKQIKLLDPNPGDRGCQMRGFLLYQFCSEESLSEETRTLLPKIKSIKAVVDQRKGCPKKPVGSWEFFQAQFGELYISKKMEFLTQCYLLAKMRQRKECLPNGVIRTKTESSLLQQLMPKLRDVEKPGKLVEVAQARISVNSLELLLQEATKITSFFLTEKEHLLKVLSMSKRPTAGIYEPKTFGCMFYEYKAILSRLREMQGLVCFKSIVPEVKTPFKIILLRPQEAGGEFQLVPDEEYQALSNELVVVFESVMNRELEREAFAKKVVEIGFTRLILEAAAIEDPFDQGSKLEEIGDTEAQEEIRRYREYAKQDGCQTNVEYPEVVMLDHVYCNTVSAELKQKGGTI